MGLLAAIVVLLLYITLGMLLVKRNYPLLGTIIIVGGMFLSLFVIVKTMSVKTDKNIKYIDYPEEIQVAEQGNLLRVEKVTKDTIYLGFYHHEPK